MDLKKIKVLVQKSASYALPVLTAAAAGKVNPFPASSKYHSLVVPAAAFVAGYIQLRMHPNGVNGPAVDPAKGS